MTELNKELPKEVHGKIDGDLKKLKAAYYIGCLPINEDEFKVYRKWAETGAKVAQSHYAPIIEDLKQKYDQSDREADHWESKYIISDAKVQAQAEQLSEKDKRIAELEAERYKYFKEAEKYEDKAIKSDMEVVDLTLQLKKVMGLLKDIWEDEICDPHAPSSMVDELFKNYCKENGIDLGGE